VKNKINIYNITSFVFICMILISCGKQSEDEINCDGSKFVYSTDVKFIINSNCVSSGCHNTGSANGDYTYYEGLKASATNGRLYERVITDKNMPPSKSLSLEDRKKIKCWINSGAPNN
jgi:hypothetical protein